MTKNSKPKRHHYLPQFYLRGFSDKGFGDKRGRVRTLDLVGQKCFTASPKDVANIADYNTIDGADGQPDVMVESKLLGRVDTEGARIIGAIEKTHDLPIGDDWMQLCLFVASLQVRIPWFRQGNHEIFQHMIDIFCQGRFRDAESFEEDKISFEKGTGAAIQGSFEEVKQAIEVGGIPVAVSRNENVYSMVRTIPDIAAVACKMTPYLMVATEKGRFITSDVPIYKFDSDEERRRSGLEGVGWGTPEVEITIPLTKNCCLLLVWGDRNLPRPLLAKDFAVANCNFFRLATCSQYAFSDGTSFPFLSDDENYSWGEDEAIKRFARPKDSYAMSVSGGGVARRPPKQIRR